MLRTVIQVDVALLHWPFERERRALLEREGNLRLLLIEADGTPPVARDGLEDWIRTPADPGDLELRIDGLIRRARASEREVPRLEGGVLRHSGSWVSLPPAEARLVAVLIARFGAVVSRAELTRSGWPDGAADRNVLDVHMSRLRRRTTALGLTIKTVRSRGYLLEVDRSRRPIH